MDLHFDKRLGISKHIIGAKEASTKQPSHTALFLQIRLNSNSNNSKSCPPNKWPRKQKNVAIEIFWNKPPSKPAVFEQQERP